MFETLIHMCYNSKKERICQEEFYYETHQDFE